LKNSNFIKNRISTKKKYQVLAQLSKKKSFYSKKHLLNKKKIRKILKKGNTLREVPFKSLYLNSFTRKKIEPIQKYKPIRFRLNGSAKDQLNLNSIVQGSLSTDVIENQIKFLINRNIINQKLGTFLINWSKLLLLEKPHLLISFLVISLKIDNILEDFFLTTKILSYSKNFYFLNNLLLSSIEKQIVLKPFLLYKSSKKSIHYSFLKKRKKISSKKDLFLL